MSCLRLCVRARPGVWRVVRMRDCLALPASELSSWLDVASLIPLSNATKICPKVRMPRW